MTANQPQQAYKSNQAILTDDGELRDVPGSQADSAIMYCTQCGTASHADARFCRTCGHSLDDQAAQVVYTPPEQKLKRADLRVVERRSAPMTFFALVFNLIKLGIILGTVSTLYLKTSNVVMPIIILIAWVIVEAAQAESAKR